MTGPVIHELKCWSRYFAAIWDGTKRFEVRRDDRGFEVGHHVWLRECEELAVGSVGYTGREWRGRITYILREFMGLADGYCALGLRAAREGSDPEGGEAGAACGGTP